MTVAGIRIPEHFTPPHRLMNNLLAVASIDFLICIIGVIVSPARIWPNILLANYYLLSLGLGAIFFIAVQYVSNAGWSVALRRVPEAMTSVLPISGVLLLATLYGTPVLYEWSRASSVAHDPVLQSKSFWLNTPFFASRTVVYFALWFLFSLWIVNTSRKQDADGAIHHTMKNRKLSGAFLPIFGVTVTLASMDWVMSLEARWYSTIFGIYNFAGIFLNSLAAMAILVILLRRMGPFRYVVTEKHLHDLGKLIFAFSTFWMYVWFSQYLLIWYANIPEEVTYLLHRQHGSWSIFTILNVGFNWVIPFIVLLPKWTKQTEGLLLRVCIILMIGHWIDLFWMILPPFMPGGPVLSLWEIGPIAGAVLVFFYATFRTLSKWNVVPVKDPMLIESLPQHHES